MSDSDPLLTAVAASIQNVIARLLPAGFACVIVVQRGGTGKMRVVTNCTEAASITMLEGAKQAKIAGGADFERATQ